MNFNNDIPVVTGGNFKFSTIEYNYEKFLEKIKEESISDFKIQQDILMHFEDYCNYDNFQNGNYRKTFQELWSNEKFVNAFLSCVPKIKKDLKKYYNKFLCKIAYDYYSEKDENSSITSNLFQIVKEVNLDYVLPLSSIMQENHATFLTMCKFSSFDQKECIERINNFLIKSGYDFSVRELIDIYIRLSRNDHFTTYFKFTMTHIMENLEQHEAIMYYRTTNAMLIIINSMPMTELVKLLSGYCEFLQFNQNLKPRLDIYKLEFTEYDRILNGLKMI